MKIIEVNDVSKRFEITHQKRDTLKENFVGFLKRNENKKEVIWALKDITFDVEKGECIGIVGENASGKTTLLKIVGKFLKPSDGEVTVRGKIAPLLTLGVGFESELTAKENIYLYGSLMGLNQKQIDEKYENIVKFSELENFMDTELKNFSSGMVVRLGFATAINVDADILLVDEVLSVGDGAFQKKCLDKFEEFKREGKTILFVSHGLDSIKKHCDRAMFLYRGQIKAIGETEKVVELYEGHLASKQLKLHNLEVLREIRKKSSDKLPYIKDFKIFNQGKEEHYVLESGNPFYLLFIPVNVPSNTTFTATIHKENGKIILFSKNFERGIARFKVDSLPLAEGNYEISIGCLGNINITGPHKFKISVKGEAEHSDMIRIFIENPITLGKEILAFGKNSEYVLEDFEKGGTLMCFETIEEAMKNSVNGTFFLRKKPVFSGDSEDIVERYKKRIYDTTVRNLIKLQI